MSAGGRLGLVQSFPVNDHDFVEACLQDLQQLRVSRLRTYLSWDVYSKAGGAAWYLWLFQRLARQVEVLPCLHETPPPLSRSGSTAGPPRDPAAFAGFVGCVLAELGQHFPAVELWRHPTRLSSWDWRLDREWRTYSAMIATAAQRVRQHGARVVLGCPSPADRGWLNLMGQRSILGLIDAIGVSTAYAQEALDGDGERPDWEGLLSDIRQSVEPFGVDLALWITETGHGRRNSPDLQLRAFVAAADAPAERLYWSTLRDDAPAQADEAAHATPRSRFGVLRRGGAPTLLGRILPQGLTELKRTASLTDAPFVASGRHPLLITGGAGFIGCNLADRLARDGESVLVLDSLARPGVEDNLAWLRNRHPRRIAAVMADVRDASALTDAARDADAVFHLAAQVAVTSSMLDPEEDLQVNLIGTFNLLQALRHRKTPCIFASTNKVYGHLNDMRVVRSGDSYQPENAELLRHGWGEDGGLDFRTPYGCSKGAADQYVLDYAGNFAVPTAVMRMSCIYGPRQRGTEDQGWVAHFVLRALADQEITIYGNGCQVRDILHVDDAVRAYIAAWRSIGRISGGAFNLGGGPGNAVSLLQLIRHIASLIGRPIAVRHDAWRPNDQRYYVSDIRRVRQALSLPAPLDWRSGVADLVRHLASRDERGTTAQPAGLVPA
jgi:CDP-paratose 2-epimerase